MNQIERFNYPEITEAPAMSYYMHLNRITGALDYADWFVDVTGGDVPYQWEWKFKEMYAPITM